MVRGPAPRVPGAARYHSRSATFLENLSTCAASHRFCGPIHSEDTNLFQTMKKPVTGNTSFPLLPVSLPVIPGSLGPLVPWSFGPLRAVSPVPSVRRSAFCFRHAAPTIFTNLSICADTHSFCDAIHSRGTHLFRIMKTPIAIVACGPMVRGPVLSGPIVPGPVGRRSRAPEVDGSGPLPSPISYLLSPWEKLWPLLPV